MSFKSDQLKLFGTRECREVSEREHFKNPREGRTGFALEIKKD